MNIKLAKHLIMFGKLLRALTTTSSWKLDEGTRLNAVPNGNNVNGLDNPRVKRLSSLMSRICFSLNDSTGVGLKILDKSNDSLRYSLLLTERLGMPKPLL